MNAEQRVLIIDSGLPFCRRQQPAEGGNGKQQGWHVQLHGDGT